MLKSIRIMKLGFLFSCPTSLVVLAFAPLRTLEARKVAERLFPSGQPRLTLTWHDEWGRTPRFESPRL